MIQLVYILAASHSGSTLLSMLLASHSKITTVGEMNLSPNSMGKLDCYRCSCGELIQECGFWQEVKKGMASRGFEFDLAHAGTDFKMVSSIYAKFLLKPMYRGNNLERIRDITLSLSPSWRNQFPEILRRNTALAFTISEIRKAEVIVDSSKIALRLKFLLRNPELSVKVIRLIRDGRGVALAYMDPAEFADAKDPALRDGGSGGQRKSERLSITEAAYQWRRCNEEAENILPRLDKSQWIEIRYEELCKDTQNTLGRLFGFLGFEPDKQAQEFRMVENHVVGNGMRLDTTSEIQLDERWREYLTNKDLHIFNGLAGEMNRRYGYF